MSKSATVFIAFVLISVVACNGKKEIAPQIKSNYSKANKVTKIEVRCLEDGFLIVGKEFTADEAHAYLSRQKNKNGVVTYRSNDKRIFPYEQGVLDLLNGFDKEQVEWEIPRSCPDELLENSDLDNVD